jgi:chromosome segregation ATPase
VIFITTVIVYILSKTKSHAIAYNLQGIKKRNNLTLKTMDNTEQKPLTAEEYFAVKFKADIEPLTWNSNYKHFNTYDMIQFAHAYASQQTEQLTSYFEKVLATKVRILEGQHKEQTEALQAELSERRREIDALRKVMNHSGRVNEGEIKSLESEKEALQNLVELKTAFIKEQDNDINRLKLWGQQEISNLQAEVEKLKFSVQSLSDSILSYEAEVEGRGVEIRVLRDGIKPLQNTIDDLRGKWNFEAEQNEKLKAEVERLNKLLNEKDARSDKNVWDLRRVVSEQQKRISQLEEALRRLQDSPLPTWADKIVRKALNGK